MIALEVPTSEAFGVHVESSGGVTSIMVLSRKDLAAIPRAESFPPLRGHWFLSGEKSVTIACPKCGALHGWDSAVHTIEDDGCVRPSWVCANNCGYHRFIRLERWPGSLKTRKEG